MKRVITFASPLILLFASTLSFAYESQDIVLRAGLTNVAPDEDSGHVIVNDLGGDTEMSVSVDSNTQLGLNIVYFFSSDWAIELLAATPFEHTISLENSVLNLGDGDLATVKHLPPTLSALYYPANANSHVQPYIGLGLNYTVFFDESFENSRGVQGFNDLSLDSSFGISAQLGLDYILNKTWSINASVRYISISTTADFNVGTAAASVDVDIDPWVYTVSMGYTF